MSNTIINSGAFPRECYWNKLERCSWPTWNESAERSSERWTVSTCLTVTVRIVIILWISLVYTWHCANKTSHSAGMLGLYYSVKQCSSHFHHGNWRVGFWEANLLRGFKDKFSDFTIKARVHCVRIWQRWRFNAGSESVCNTVVTNVITYNCAFLSWI